MQPQPNTENNKMVPLDTSGDSVDVEIKEEEKKVQLFHFKMIPLNFH